MRFFFWLIWLVFLFEDIMGSLTVARVAVKRGAYPGGVWGPGGCEQADGGLQGRQDVGMRSIAAVNIYIMA